MILQDIKLNKTKNNLILTFDNQQFVLSAEFLRVNSPSAEVQNHGNPILQFGKKNVLIDNLELVGNYSLKIHFSDKHNTGLFSFDYLEYLSLNQKQIWDKYLNDLHKNNKHREENTQTIKFIEAK